jgi:hypothetical protein
MINNILSSLCSKYKANKPSYYLEQYDNIFSPKKLLPINLLEIGIQSGGSLKMWEEYFFKGKIFGIDIDLKFCKASNHFCGSQSDISFLQKVISTIGQLDIIIDDGSHYNNDQQISFNFLFLFLNQKGIYVIEDMHDHRPEFYCPGYIHTKEWIKTLPYKSLIMQDIGFIFKE